MTELTIDLREVHRHLNRVQENIEVVNTNLGVIHGKVQFVADEQRLTKERLEDLYGEFAHLYVEFRDFVAADRKEKAKQYAATELVRVQQEIEQRFGHHDLVRRTTTGILQATDVQIVRQNTMHTVTEQLMITTPSYWLAPALVALTGWIKDDQPLAEKAAAEAIHRDDNKTSLFFALVCRRARRAAAATRWLSRYFQMQNPTAIDREVSVMLDGVANGVFGEEGLTACSAVTEQWLAELEQQAGFLDEQRRRWAAQLDLMTPKPGEADYPSLRRFSPTAPQLLAALCAARRHQIVYDYFSGLFAGELIVAPSIEAAVDALLDSLVTNFDDEELPLRHEKRLLELIKLEDGDKDAAQKRHDAEMESYQEKTNFAALLTSAAMNPEQTGATRATQRYAVSRSRQWIFAAHSDLLARDREKRPRQVELAIGSWKGTSADGSNAASLAADMKTHYAQRIDAAVAAVTLGAGPWIALCAGVLIGLLIALQGGAAILFGLIIAGAAGAYFYWKFKELDRVRQSTREGLEKEQQESARALTACLAELAQYRREIAAEDGRSAAVVHLLTSLKSPVMQPEQRVSIA